MLGNPVLLFDGKEEIDGNWEVVPSELGLLTALHRTVVWNNKEERVHAHTRLHSSA